MPWLERVLFHDGVVPKHCGDDDGLVIDVVVFNLQILLTLCRPVPGALHRESLCVSEYF